MKIKYKLKWHKFTIYFALFTAAIISLIAAVPFFSGKTFAILNGSQIIFNSAAIYSKYPMMHTFNILFGIFFIMYALLIIITRYKLAAFKKNSPRLLYTCFCVSALITVAYALTTIFEIGFFRIHIYLIAVSVIAAAVGIIVYAIYYGKRKDLFIN